MFQAICQWANEYLTRLTFIFAEEIERDLEDSCANIHTC